MGRSIHRPSEHPSGGFFHAPSRTAFSVSSTADGVVQSIARGGLRAQRRIDYVIGSGNAAFGYLVRVGDSVFQSPVAYYSGRGRFDMAPGMEQFLAPDFTRPATPECLWCHSGRPRPRENTVNRYADEVFEQAAISCARCHGPPEAHLEAPSAENIVNPAALGPVERDSVCEQCHLSGSARVLSPGRDYGDFRPGMRLEEVLSVYVPEVAGNREFKVVSHSEQLQRSRCYEASGRELWCGTCHDPHRKPVDSVAFFRGRCRDCHTALADGHGAAPDDCVGCHMPKRRSRDSGHSAFTDHRIQRLPGDTSPAPRPRGLTAWREPESAYRERNRAIASIQVGEAEGRPNMVRRGLRLLAKAVEQFPDDPALWDWRGLAQMRIGRPERAVEAYERAVQLNPTFPLYRTALAAAYWELREPRRAVEQLERAIELDPGLYAAYSMLAEIRRSLEGDEAAQEPWRRLLEWNPESLTARERLGRRE